MFKWLLILHVLTACIWIGGHLLLSLRYLPEALQKRNPDIIKAFEKKYEIVGLPSLLLQVITGVWMAISYYHVNLFSFAKMKLQLEELLQKPVDLVSENGLSPHIKPFIDQEKVLIYEK